MENLKQKYKRTKNLRQKTKVEPNNKKVAKRLLTACIRI